MDSPYNSLSPPTAADSNYGSCSWEGLQMSCEMKTRLSQNSERIDALIARDGQPSQTVPPATATDHEHLHASGEAQATTETAKPDDSDGDPKPIKPGAFPCEDSERMVCTRGLPADLADSRLFRREWDSKLWADVRRAVRCDDRLARIFGDGDAMMATSLEPSSLLEKKPDGTISKRAMYPRANLNDENPALGIVHLFANSQGRGVDAINAFTPPGYKKTEGGKKTTSSGELQNFRRFYYEAGSLSSYGYKGGLIVNFTHIGPTNGSGDHVLHRGVQNAAGSVSVGVLGAYGSLVNVGGETDGFYTHSHMIFNTWDGKSAVSKRTRVDPRSIFCGNLGF